MAPYMTPMRILATFLVLLTIGASAMAAEPKTETAIFAGGCFWCMQPEFDNMQGVSKTVVGYTGGSVANPTYEQVSTDTTGHYEAIEITYDPARVKYEDLLDVYWHNIDPLDAGGQNYDRGQHYQTAIFVNGPVQQKLAEESKKKVEAFFAPRPVATKILPAKPFYPAEDYHQKYYEKSSMRYKAYKTGSGREENLKQLWKK